MSKEPVKRAGPRRVPGSTPPQSRRSCAARTPIRSRCSGCRRPAARLVARAFIDGAEEVEAFTLGGQAGWGARAPARAGLLRGAAEHPQAPAAELPRPQRRRRVVGHRRLFLRAGARADGRLLHRRGHAPAALRQARRASDPATRAPRACTSRSGRRTRGGSAWSATSTPGTGGATRCASAATPASGRSSCPDVGAGATYKYEIIGAGRRAAAAEGRSRSRAPPELRPKTASVVAPWLDHDWGDADALGALDAATDARREPISIYEVHPGSWRRRAGRTGS